MENLSNNIIGKFLQKRFSGILLLAVLLFLASGCSMRHYEKGTDYLQNKQYSEALAEFQKIDPDEKDYRMAQSKINYIQGLLAFNDSLMQVAETHLQKVEKDDEYYHVSQLMLEKIAESRLAATMPEGRKDTIILKQEPANVPGTSTESRKEALPTDAEINSRYVSSVERLINRFETQYQSARNSDVSVKREYVTNMNRTMGELEGITYNPSVKNAEIVDLRNKAAAWMNKRIQFVNKMISDNTVSETNTSRSLREEGDKMYYGLTTQLRRVR